MAWVATTKAEAGSRHYLWQKFRIEGTRDPGDAEMSVISGDEGTVERKKMKTIEHESQTV